METENSYYNELLKAKSRNTRNSFAKLKRPFRKIKTGQKTLSYYGPSLWNNLPNAIKNPNNLNTLKHNVKSLYLNQ